MLDPEDPEDPEGPEDEGELEDNEVLYSDMIFTCLFSLCISFIGLTWDGTLKISVQI